MAAAGIRTSNVKFFNESPAMDVVYSGLKLILRLGGV